MIRLPVHKFTWLCSYEAQEYAGFSLLISVLSAGSGMLGEDGEVAYVLQMIWGIQLECNFAFIFILSNFFCLMSSDKDWQMPQVELIVLFPSVHGGWFQS